jgi:Na+-transporting methylmalonyl-CoA/oxaloacetate decarboxylase gamma subunit
MSTTNLPRGPGLFEVGRLNGERFVTNVRRIAGADRAPGAALVSAATILLGLLAAGLFVVSLAAQYRYVFAVKHQSVPSAIEAVGLDVGMVVFSLLALGLAMAGQSARIERALIVICAVASAGQNYAAADVTSPRSVAAYVMPPLFLALVVDRVVAVVRRHVLGDAERSVWAAVGRGLAALVKGLGLVLLYLLRLVLAPPSTSAGLRRLVLIATPLPAAEKPEKSERQDAEDRDDETKEPSELEGASKRARLAWWYERDAAYGDRTAVAAAAKRLAPVVGLGEGTARAYIGQILAEPRKEGRAS